MADGKQYDLGYIGGKVDQIDRTLTAVSQTMVTKEHCGLVREGLEKRTKKHSEDIEKLKARPADVTGAHRLPVDFDIWAWLKRRIPVVLGLIALGGIAYAARTELADSQRQAKDNATRLERLIRARPAPQPVVIPQPVFIQRPDAGPQPRPRRRRGSRGR